MKLLVTVEKKRRRQHQQTAQRDRSVDRRRLERDEEARLGRWLLVGAEQPVEDGGQRQIQRQKQQHHLVIFTPALHSTVTTRCKPAHDSNTFHAHNNRVSRAEVS